MLVIDIRNIPEDGVLPLEGALDGDIAGLPPEDPVQPAGPLTYKAEASLVSDNLLLRGEFSQPFRLQCVRCLAPFEHRVRLVGHSLLAPLEAATRIDLTDTLREDILLALPSFPHCDEDGSGDPQARRECPASGDFSTDDSFRPLDPEQDEDDGPDTWGALDNLKLD